jgi:acetamidase/formamidase
MSWKKVWFILFLAALVTWFWPLDKSAQAIDLQRFEATGQIHVLGVNEFTSTPGFFDRDEKPVLKIGSGDTVVIETGTHHMGKMVPGVTFDEVRQWHREEKAASLEKALFWPGGPKKGYGHHHLTGPIYIDKAEPGDVLEIEVLEAIPKPYCFSVLFPGDEYGLGFLPKDFPKSEGLTWHHVDKETMTIGFAPGIAVPAEPYPGIIGVSYPEKGRYSSVPPGRIGGNTDNRHLVKGSVIYLPVWVKGALLKTGDTHIAQGNGEITVSACEGAFDTHKLRITVRKDLKLNWPLASTPENWVIMGFDLDLKQAARMATLKAIDFLVNNYGLPRDQAYMLGSMAVNLEITQLVDKFLGVHAVIPKKIFIGDQYAASNGLKIKKNVSFTKFDGPDQRANKKK